MITPTNTQHSNYQNDATQRKNRVFHHPDDDLLNNVWSQSYLQSQSARLPQCSGAHPLFGELFRLAWKADPRQSPRTESDVQKDRCPVFGDADGVCQDLPKQGTAVCQLRWHMTALPAPLRPPARVNLPVIECSGKLFER
jgi:hypothetical protein